MLRSWRVSLYTFIAVNTAVFVVGAIIAPSFLGYLQATYYRLQSDVNRRHARAMTQFVTHRLESGASPDQVVREFQAAIEGTQIDRGYVCLIRQPDVRYLCHPDPDALGMSVKPNAVFDPEFRGEDAVGWQELIRRGRSGSGLLHVGPNMAPEIVFFNSVPGSEWTVSSHENASRIHLELASLRRNLTLGAIAMGLLTSLPASWAARRVGIRNEAQLKRRNELERQFLESENARKTHELEQARELQISMLPKAVPDHQFLEVAAAMRTATEVGGDYYDFASGDDGSLTIAIGDAAGHGVRAGVIVTAMKSLFGVLASEARLDSLLRQASKVLRRITPPNLYMAFAVARLHGRTLELAGAGMPPGLVHRRRGGEIENISLSGVPLGVSRDIAYQTSRIELFPGDTIVLMSDGLPELFNEEREMFGYTRPAEILRDASYQRPEEILDRFMDAVQLWAGGRPLDDDVTVIVMRVKETGVRPSAIA